MEINELVKLFGIVQYFARRRYNLRLEFNPNHFAMCLRRFPITVDVSISYEGNSVAYWEKELWLTQVSLTLAIRNATYSDNFEKAENLRHLLNNRSSHLMWEITNQLRKIGQKL